MCEGQEQERKEIIGSELGPPPVVTLDSSVIGTWSPPCAFLLLGLHSPKEDSGDFERDFLVLISHFSKTFLCLQDQIFLPVKKEGRILSQLRKPGF